MPVASKKNHLSLLVQPLIFVHETKLYSKAMRRTGSRRFKTPAVNQTADSTCSRPNKDLPEKIPLFDMKAMMIDRRAEITSLQAFFMRDYFCLIHEGQYGYVRAKVQESAPKYIDPFSVTSKSADPAVKPDRTKRFNNPTAKSDSSTKDILQWRSEPASTFVTLSPLRRKTGIVMGSSVPSDLEIADSESFD